MDPGGIRDSPGRWRCHRQHPATNTIRFDTPVPLSEQARRDEANAITRRLPMLDGYPYEIDQNRVMPAAAASGGSGVRGAIDGTIESARAATCAPLAPLGTIVRGGRTFL